LLISNSLLAKAGDYGLGGDSPNGSLRNVGEVGVALKMPIFDGGMIKGEIQEAESNKRQSQLIFNDLGKQGDEDVRLALQSLVISAKQVRAAKKVHPLAQR
jgi:outer membrane protein TolC